LDNTENEYVALKISASVTCKFCFLESAFRGTWPNLFYNSNMKKKPSWKSSVIKY